MYTIAILRVGTNFDRYWLWTVESWINLLHPQNITGLKSGTNEQTYITTDVDTVDLEGKNQSTE